MQISTYGLAFSGPGKRLRLILLTMRLIILLTAFACLQVAARGYSQPITLRLSNAPLEQVFKEIKRQSGYRFVYTKEEIAAAGRVTVQLTNVSLRTALDSCLKRWPLTYHITDNYVVIRYRPLLVNHEAPLNKPAEISGKLTLETGEPVVNATVTAKRSGKTTRTNQIGEFVLKDIADNEILVISSVEIETLEASIAGKNFLQLVARKKVNMMEETIVKGYYNSTRLLNTGSVGKVSAEEISRQPVSNPLVALQARVPGLFITQSNGLPGSNFEILVRGRNSLQQGTRPLIVVDGVPFSTERMSQNVMINANNPFNTIDPSDIASIEVLKDADATAIYGSRGANGVILITTRRSKAQHPELHLSWYAGWGRVTRTMDFMTTPDYLTMRKEAFANDGLTPTTANAPDLLVWDTSRYTDWKREMIGGTAPSLNVTLRYAAGNELTRFSFHAGYYKEGTVFPAELGNKRINFGLGVTQFSKNRKFSADFTAKYAVDDSRLLNQDFTSFINLAPNAPAMYEADGSLRWYEKGVAFNNPFSLLLQDYQGVTSRLSTNAVASYNLLSGLTAKLSLGFNEARFDETGLTPIVSQHPSNNPRGIASFGNAETETFIAEPQLDYSRNHKKWLFNATAGGTFQQTKTISTQQRGTGYTNDALLRTITGAATVTATDNREIYKYAAVFTRFSLSYDKRYLLNLTGRRDGSSRFGPGNQFANFGAIGAGWVFSNEPFLKPQQSWLNYGKIRGSYGITGNDQISNYQYLESWTGTSYTYGSVPGLRPVKLFNPDYRWEQNRKLELALELGLLKDRIQFTASWFNNLSGNQIINYVLPAQSGFRSVLRNFPGLIRNRGFELEISSRNIQSSRFTWSSSFNLTRAQNRLLDFPGLESSSYASRYRIGHPVNLQIGYEYIGVNPQTGVYQFRDFNNDGLINTMDYTVNGTTDPEFYGGLGNLFEYKGFQLSLFFQFVRQQGRHFIFGSAIRAGRNTINQYAALKDRWTKPGDQATYQRYTAAIGTDAYNAGGLVMTSSALLTDASFVRLKNLSLTYELGKKMKVRALQTLQVFVQAQNLFTITRYEGGDPENQNSQALPPLKMVATGIQLKL